MIRPCAQEGCEGQMPESVTQCRPDTEEHLWLCPKCGYSEGESYPVVSAVPLAVDPLVGQFVGPIE